MTKGVTVATSNQIRELNPEPGLRRYTGAHNEKLLLAEHRMEKGWIGAAHRHPHDQVAYIVSGKLRVTAAGEAFELIAGESFTVAGGVEHQAEALEDSVVIDVFTPCRDEYL